MSHAVRSGHATGRAGPQGRALHRQPSRFTYRPVRDYFRVWPACLGLLLLVLGSATTLSAATRGSWAHWRRPAPPSESTSQPAGSTSSSASQPNIIVVLADDLGPDCVGVYGSETFSGRTPNIDAMASDGLRFERAYASAICSPSRSQLLTGQYPFRNGCLDIDGSSSYINHDNSISIAEVLQQAGYTSSLIGKGMSLPGPSDTWGFDEWALASTGHYWGGSLNLNGVTVSFDDDEYLPDLLHSEALRFIRRNKEQPFFLCYSLINPHTPIEPTPSSKAGTTDEDQLFIDNIRYIDRQIGSLRNVLGNLGLLNNTILIFTGDNGTEGRFQSRLWDPKSASYRRIDGAKADRGGNREGGSLVPLIVQWPHTVAGGQVSDALIDFTDFMKTFAEVAGASIPSGYQLDGHSFASLLTGDADWNPRGWVYHQIEDNWCVRGKTYRLNGDGRLFDIRDLPFSMTEVPKNSGNKAAENHRNWFQGVLDRFDPSHGPTFETHQDNHTNAYHGPYEPWLWKKTHFQTFDLWATEISGDWSDPDHDGVTNIYERAFGWDPTNGTDVMPRAVEVNQRLQITYPVPGGDVRITPQVQGRPGDPWLNEPISIRQSNGQITARDQQTAYANEAMRIQAQRIHGWNPSP